MSDSIKLFFTYSIALITLVGGGAMLYLTYQDPTADNLQLVLSGFMGAAITYVFQSETQTRTARLQEKALMTGVVSQEPIEKSTTFDT